ncbi:MAG TPA: hypothetical protein VGS58_21145 [Candidatus Sulfopaludibacter sp.]|nr:hypothetical protein [Candidatus Sulfopaludibacter sp.]
MEGGALVGEQWADSIIGFVMAFSAVLAALNALVCGRRTPAKLENAAALAHWSRSYAVRVYHLSKTLGLLKASPRTAPIGSSDEEDEILAAAGLDDYVEALVDEDRP